MNNMPRNPAPIAPSLAQQIASLRKIWSEALFSSEAGQFREQSAIADMHANEAFDVIVRAYRESTRHYHNLNHLTFLFDLDKGNPSTEFQLKRVMFFFFHDYFYHINPSQPVTDNESKSAEVARYWMLRMGFQQSMIDWVCEVICLSNHDGTPCTDQDKLFLLDSDLAILGAEHDVYVKYFSNVRLEYQAVPMDIWEQKRKDFLNFMLGKTRIFRSDYFYQEREQQARKNMQNELGVWS